jgi:hypothetical protein
MTINHHSQADDLESRLKEVGEENELLLSQLHQVQEELEQYYLRNQVLENERPVDPDASLASGKGWVDDELLEALAESERLRSIVAVQQKVHRLEAENTLSAKLGNLLIQSVESPRALLALPGKLGKIWRTYSRHTPPESLGGKGFGKVAAAYAESGFDAVEKLLAGVTVSPVTRASGYTVLGRHLMYSDPRNAAEAARRAHALDPKPYRLKWLAFRLHEAGDVVEAEAMLDLLPADTKFSDSEARQAGQLRDEARDARLSEAKEKTGCAERRAEIERQLSRITLDRDARLRLATECAQQVEALKKVNAQAEQEKLLLARRYEDAVKQVVQCNEEMDALKRVKAELERDKWTLAQQNDELARQAAERAREYAILKKIEEQVELEKSAIADRYDEAQKLLTERGEEVEGLKRVRAQLEQEQLVLAGRQADVAGQAAERAQQLEALKKANAQMEQERLALASRHDEVEQQAAARGRQIEILEREKLALVVRYEEAAKQSVARGEEVEALKQAKMQVEQEKLALISRHDEAAKQSAACRQELDGLKRANAQLEQEKSTLAGRHDEAVKQATTRAQEVDVLKQAKAQLEQERSAMAGRYDEAARLAAERLMQINALQQKIQSREAGEAELAARQQLIQDEMVRAEAQLDLIKEMLFHESRL